MNTILKKFLNARVERGSPEENFFISSGMEFYGDLVARSSSGRIDGRFEGHIIECKRIIIGPDANIKGNIFAQDILLYGYCEGNLYASGDVKIFNTSVILGDIYTSSLLVEKDSTFRGNVRQLKSEELQKLSAQEKEKILQQRKSNVYSIHSLQARAEADAIRKRKVVNAEGPSLFSEHEDARSKMKTVHTTTVPSQSPRPTKPAEPTPVTQNTVPVQESDTIEDSKRWF